MPARVDRTRTFLIDVQVDTIFDVRGAAARLNRRRLLAGSVRLPGAAAVARSGAVPVDATTSDPDVTRRSLTEQEANLAIDRARWFQEL